MIKTKKNSIHIYIFFFAKLSVLVNILIRNSWRYSNAVWTFCGKKKKKCMLLFTNIQPHIHAHTYKNAYYSVTSVCVCLWICESIKRFKWSLCVCACGLYVSWTSPSTLAVINWIEHYPNTRYLILGNHSRNTGDSEPINYNSLVKIKDKENPRLGNRFL